MFRLASFLALVIPLAGCAAPEEPFLAPPSAQTPATVVNPPPALTSLPAEISETYVQSLSHLRRHRPLRRSAGRPPGVESRNRREVDADDWRRGISGTQSGSSPRHGTSRCAGRSDISSGSGRGLCSLGLRLPRGSVCPDAVSGAIRSAVRKPGTRDTNNEARTLQRLDLVPHPPARYHIVRFDDSPNSRSRIVVGREPCRRAHQDPKRIAHHVVHSSQSIRNANG